MKTTILVSMILSSLAPLATAQLPPPSPQTIFGNVSGLACQGAGVPAFPGFTVFVFTFADAVKSGGSGAASGAPVFPDIAMTKGLDDCTPLLFGAVATGKRFPTVTFTVVSGNPAAPLLIVTLQNVFFTSDRFTEDGADGNIRDLDELVTMNYDRITIKHVASGNTFTFDVKKGVF